MIALQRHADRMRLIERESALMTRFTATRTGTRHTEVRALPTDVADLDGLRQVARLLVE